MSKSHSRPQEDDKPSRRSWRGGGGSGSNGASRGQPANYGWRKGRAPGSYLARKWLLGVPMIAGVVGLLVGYWIYIDFQPKPTPLVCLRVTDYEPPLVPQAFAEEDVELFREVFDPESGGDSVAVPKRNRATGPSKANDKTAFLDEVRETIGNERLGRGQPVLIYISAQGLVDDEGRPCLVLAANPAQPPAGVATPDQTLPSSRLVPVADVVDAAADALKNVGKQDHAVVLLLDAVRWDRNWRLGIAANDFAAGLENIDLGKPGRERVVIINSTKSDGDYSGEIGLVDVRRRLTLFGHYVARGLGGAADTDNSSNITLGEFEKFLTDNLQAAAARRGQSQRPLVLTRLDGSLVLASASASFEKEVADKIKKRQFSIEGDWLDNIHRGFAALAEQQADRADGKFAPAATLVLEEAQRQYWQHELQKCLAGKAYSKGTAKFPSPASTLRASENDDRENADNPELWTEAARFVPPAADGRPVPPSYSLPVALGRLSPNEDDQRRGKDALDAAPPPTKPAADGAAPAPAAAQVSPILVAWAAWDQVLREGSLQPHQQKNLEQAWQQAALLQPVELLTWSRFSLRNPFLPAEVKQAKDTLSSNWKLRHAAEQAAFFGGEPRVLPLVRAQFGELDIRRREYEDRQFIADHAKNGTAEEIIGGFERLKSEAEDAALALQVRDQALADLPYLLEWGVVGGEARASQASELLSALARLQDALDNRPADSQAPTPWKELGGAVSQAQDALVGAYADEWKTSVLAAPGEVNLDRFPSLDRLLSIPLGYFADRASLWKVYGDLVESDELAPELEGNAAPVNPQPAAVAQRRERLAAKKLLDQWLSGLPKEGAEAADSGALVSRAAFAALADRAADDLTPLPIPSLSAPDVRPPTPEDLARLAKREPLCRAFASWLSLRPGSPRFVDNSIRQQAEHAAYNSYLWQAERALDDFHGGDDALVDGRSASRTLSPFAVTSAALIAFAERSYFPKATATQQRDLLKDRLEDAQELAKVQLEFPSRPLRTDETRFAVQHVPKTLSFQNLPPGKAALRVAGEGLQVQINQSLPPQATAHDWLLPVTAQDAGWPESFRFDFDAKQQVVAPDVTYYYRGHAIRATKPIERLTRLYAVDATSPGATGKLTVRPTLSKAHVVIVLDCSASMKSWMPEANKAVRTVIDRLLLKAEDVQVSLVLFAHRRSKDSTLTDRTVAWGWNAKYGADIPTVNVFNDYDVVWRSEEGIKKLDPIIGESDGEGASDAQAQAMGFTPLFSSLVYALKSGFRDNDPANRHLVIISDGDDFVQEKDDWDAKFLLANPGKEDFLRSLTFVPPWPAEQAAYNNVANRAARAGQVKREMASRGDPKVYLFDMSRAKALAGAGGLAGLGEPVAVDRPAALADAVLAQMGVRGYTLVDKERGTEYAGSTTQKGIFPDLPIGAYELQFDRPPGEFAPLRIDGGEALEASVDIGATPPKFEFLAEDLAAIDAAARGSISLGDAANRFAGSTEPAAYEVQCRAMRAPRAGKEPDACLFDLVFKNAAATGFTQRPAELWIEVVPSAGSGPLGAYVFCNPFATKDTLSPVYKLKAPLWPDNATRAQVSVWIRMMPTQAKGVIVDAAFESPRSPADSAVPMGVQFQFDAESRSQGGVQVTITELFAHDRHPYPWHFVTPAIGQGVGRVTRIYYRGQVEHQFQFTADNLADAQRRKFVALPITDWKKNSLGLGGGKPLDVYVENSSSR
jgi:hypothetical protein